MKKIVLVQRIIPHYRVKFFDLLWEDCNALGIELFIIYGQEKTNTVPKTVDYERPWSKKIQNRYYNIFGIEFVWQPCLLEILKADGIVIEQANRLSLTYLMPILRFWGYKSAFWGHGRNLQADERVNGFRERLKKKMLFFSDYFFAYTEKCKIYLENLGYDSYKITNVQNSIDVQILKEAKITVTEKYKISRERYTVIYCGGIYKEKKIDFLIDVCNKIKSKIPDFKVIVIGEGPEDYLIRDFASSNQWLEYVGPKSGADIVPYFLRSKLLLMPGLVGLAILDSFALSTPMVTTNLPIHSPEFEYLQHQENGFVTEYDINSYVDAIFYLLNNDIAYDKLVIGCDKASDKFSIKRMSANFANGLLNFINIDSKKV